MLVEPAAAEREPGAGTIPHVIQAVLRQSGLAMSPAEIHAAIVEQDLYSFNTEDPVGVVRAQIRRRCEGLDFASAYPLKLFIACGEGRYQALDRPTASLNGVEQSPALQAVSVLDQLRQLQAVRLAEVRERALMHLRSLSPTTFEQFGRRLLEVYGFHDVRVTQVSRDGGIDGYGQLRVGLASLNVAYQCKRWGNTVVQRPEVDRFRGAIQGEFEQGVFITTSRFSRGAIEVSLRRGAVAIVLIDGAGIIDLMFERGFGISYETLRIPTFDLDSAFELGS